MTLSTNTTGKFGENYASNYLNKNSYKIIAKNYKCRFGEIDIIAFYKNILCFIEVKTRRSLKSGYPEESVTKRKQIKIKKCADYFIQSNKLNIKYRFEVISILINCEKIERFKHYKELFF